MNPQNKQRSISLLTNCPYLWNEGYEKVKISTSSTATALDVSKLSQLWATSLARMAVLQQHHLETACLMNKTAIWLFEEQAQIDGPALQNLWLPPRAPTYRVSKCFDMDIFSNKLGPASLELMVTLVDYVAIDGIIYIVSSYVYHIIYKLYKCFHHPLPHNLLWHLWWLASSS